jgi:type II secretory pathway predicted ATPase ExeA
LTQRIGGQFHLTPLAAADTQAYVNHRLEVAGAQRAIFTTAAISRLHQASGGIPRVVNHLATQALLEGMGREVEVVDEDVVATVVTGQVFLEVAG